MKPSHTLLVLCLAASVCAVPACYAQGSSYRKALERSSKGQHISDAQISQSFQEYIANGKIKLSLDDAIRLALANNTDIALDQEQIGAAKNVIESARGPFDPLLVSSFNALRSKSPTFSQLSGAPTLSSLSQNAQLGVSQTLLTGTNYQVALNANKLSSNTTFNFFNPSVSGNFTFNFSQPLLRGRGFLPNRGPMIIAQRGLTQSRETFKQEVNDVILQVVAQYWGVVQARESLDVQRKSLDEAQQTYDHDKHSLQLGALPPLDIYRSESQVAQRRVSEIQAEYFLKQTEDVFRQIIGADIDPNIRALDLDLTESPDPAGNLMNIDIVTALQKALADRPEIDAQRQRLANDDLNIKIAHNGLEPDLRLTGIYESNGLGGNQINISAIPPQIVSRGGWFDAFGQVFGFGFPGYGFGVSLTLPIKNHAGEANLGSALVMKRHDLYSDRQTRQSITLDVTNSVHQLEQSKLGMEASKIALDLAQKNLQAEQRKYALGAQPIFFTLEAQTELAQAELSLVQAEVGYRLAVTAVEHATGDLLDRFHVQVAQLSQ
ncbi:MAG TPA: TolC family protein [Candidatus Acidoferrales bacterium]|nr:TolC family protein [Candidatus Acidoferrales bacterium]